METKGLSAQDCEVNITNESVSSAQGVGSPSDDPWGVLEASGRGGRVLSRWPSRKSNVSRFKDKRKSY